MGFATVSIIEFVLSVAGASLIVPISDPAGLLFSNGGVSEVVLDADPEKKLDIREPSDMAIPPLRAWEGLECGRAMRRAMRRWRTDEGRNWFVRGGVLCVCGMRRKKVQVGVLCGVEATRRAEPDFLIFFFFYRANVTLITPKTFPGDGGGYANHSRCVRPKKP